MTTVLTTAMRARGSHATGVVTVSPKGRVSLRKDAEPAEVFLAARKGLGRSAQTALIHTRQATQGSPTNPLNNHPIQYESIIGVHNGMVRNDDDLFELKGWDRKAQVDSEAIFASIHHNPNLTQGLEEIDASWAIGWIDQSLDARTLWLARGWSSPMHYARTVGGSLVFASTEAAVRSAFVAGNICKQASDAFCEEAGLGFLACIGVDGQLDVLPTFDGTGRNAVLKPRPVYGSAQRWGHDDWETASNNYMSTVGAHHPSSHSGKGPSVPPARNGGSWPSEGDKRGMHVVGRGWLQHVWRSGGWKVIEPEPKPTPPAQTALRFAMTAASITAPPPEIGDRIVVTVKASISSALEIELAATVIGITDLGEMVVDWDASHLPIKVPHRNIGSLVQIGG